MERRVRVAVMIWGSCALDAACSSDADEPIEKHADAACDGTPHRWPFAGGQLAWDFIREP